MSKKLPQSFKPYFWSYDFSKIDSDKNKKTVVSQITNYGTIDDWRWLVRNYGWSGVRDTLIDFRPGEIKKRTLKLASIVFDFNLKDIKSHALRGSH
jgi:hypothetical protein